jgi:hypothetical protein
MVVLAVSQYLPALETVRLLAANTNAEVRAVALEALGYYGHPQDFTCLTAALQESDEMLLEFALLGAVAYGDLRAVGSVIPLLKHPKQGIRNAAFLAVLGLPTPAGWRAAIQAAKDARDPEERRAFQERLQYVLGKCPVTSDEFLKTSEVAQRGLVQKAVQAQRDDYVFKADDRKLTHEDLLKAADDWKTRGRITGGAYVWVESRHVLAAATDKDIEVLLDVRGQIMKRLSDECMPEVSILDDLIQRLGRSRYRNEVGLTEKAEGLVKDSVAP